MGRPTTKADLLAAAEGQYDRLGKLIDSMSPDERSAEFGFEDRDRNLRDVLIHLYEWHQLLLDWVRANQGGDGAPFLPAPYNWKTYPELNVVFWESHQGTSLEDAQGKLAASQAEVVNLIGTFSEEELFTKKHFSWTGSTNLASYCISSTSSHYDWAMKKLKRHIKTYGDSSSG